MLKIVRLALTRPYTFIVLALLIVLIGPLSALRTPTDIFPDIRIPVISVVWNYAGLQPDDMAGRIVTYYERTLGTTVNDVQHIESQSFRGYGIVKIFFQPNVDIRTATAQVTSVSQTVLKQMPPGTTPPQILNYNASTVPVLQLALTSNTLDEQKLADYATNFIRPQLLSVPGVAIPTAYGGKTREVQIDLDPQALQAKKLSAQDVANALAQQNQIIPAGTEKIGRFEYNIKLNNSPLSLQELNNLPIKTVNGATIYIRDVAHVRDGYPPQTNIVRVDGHRAVLMSILKNGSASTLDIIAGVKAQLPRIEETLPPGLKLVTMGDQSTFVKGAVSGVAREGIIAAALTSLMILLFLGSWRSTLIIAASIPLAVLAAIAGLSAMGETLNVMTLGGLALAVGILVDDATVTIENINWHLEQGKDVRTRDHGRRRADRRAGLRLVAVYLYRVRADAAAERHRPLPVRADGRGGDLRDGRVVRAVAHLRANARAVSAAPACVRRSCLRRTGGGNGTARRPPPRAPFAQSAGAFSARLRASLRTGARRLPHRARPGAHQSQALCDRFSDRGRRLVPARAVAGPQFLSEHRFGRNHPACARADRHTHRRHRRRVRSHRKRRAPLVPPDQLAQHHRQRRPAQQRYQPDL